MEARTGVELVYTALQAISADTNQWVSLEPHFSTTSVRLEAQAIAATEQ